MDATELELVKTTPAGAAIVAFARLCNGGITEFCETGKISPETMSLMVDGRTRLVENEEAARVLNDAALRQRLMPNLGEHASRMYKAAYGQAAPTMPGVLA